MGEVQTMKKRILLILAGVLLVLALAACSGGGKITDGVYLPEDGAYALYSSLEFRNGEITIVNPEGTISVTSAYKFRKDGAYGWVIECEDSIFPFGTNNRIQVTEANNDKIVLIGALGTYYRQK
jgi:hypothetical protein